MMTGVGVILGTAAYMAPEQAKGRAVDRRCDIWAFGCILFEMLTGRRAFPGDDLTEVLAAVVRGEPEWGALPPETPSPIRTLLKRCLEKDAARRIADASTLRFVIDEVGTLAALPPTAPQAARPERWRVLHTAPAAISALVALALAVPAIRHLREAAPVAAPEMRLDIATPPSSYPESFALSPDGRSLVFVASDGGRPKLWLRALDQTTPKVISGTDDGIAPFWSPDGRSIGFFAAGKLLRLDLESGVPRAVADAPSPVGGTWTASGSILFTPATVSPIMRVPANGGPAEALTQLTSGQTSHTVPIALPDGRHFVFSVLGTPATQGIYLGSFDKSAPKKLLPAAMAGAFLPPDRIAYVLTDRIVTQRLDLATETLVGEPATISSFTINRGTVGGPKISASANGLLAYRSGVGTYRALMWRDRSGNVIGRVGNAVDQFPALSPDERAIAGTRSDFDIWLTDVARSSETRWTFDPAIDALPVWSPDSRRLAFASNRSGSFAIYVGPVSHPGSEERLFVSQYPTIAQDWSSDGRWLLYYENRPGVGRDLWALDVTSPDRKRRPVATTPAEETLAKFSPDGRWVAYQTHASGRFEIVVKAFGDGDGAAQGGMWQVSRSGGVAPVWSRDGRELYFFAPDGTLQASSITSGKDTIEVGSPVRLFTARVGGAGGIDAGTVYCVSRDGRFLISEVVDADVPPITIVVNPKF